MDDEGKEGKILIMLTEIKSTQVEHGKKLDRVDHALYGNGKPGLLSEHGICQERLRRIEEDSRELSRKKFVKEMIRYAVNAAVAAGIAVGIVKGVK